MAVFLFTFGLFLVVVLAMAVGVIVQRKTIAGSCGGLGELNIDKACDCDKPCEKRRKRLEKEQFWQDNKII
tara:strand:+ start:4293 stop:4505 length:213 start_codon:yes stop_codon:yes gene_type:complete